ncbi:COP1-interacting protein-related [Striga asiatica]|uniref:COP1-interacting protein-related n=1 Tax=Striga asiatica TaxID=4170 RepID=A0A5A7PSX2_STRAF|nr:COP1-interacting protein-related [Striga asiatica]
MLCSTYANKNQESEQRCDLVIFAGKKSEKIASGLLEPFIPRHVLAAGVSIEILKAVGEPSRGGSRHVLYRRARTPSAWTRNKWRFWIVQYLRLQLEGMMGPDEGWVKQVHGKKDGLHEWLQGPGHLCAVVSSLNVCLLSPRARKTVNC